MARIGLVVAAVGVGLAIAPASWAQTQGEMARTCAASDLRALNLIEDQAPGASGSAVEAASLALMQARRACAAGRHGEGLALYETITLTAPKASVASAAR